MFFGRTLGSVLVAAALVLAPAPALAGVYPGDDEDILVTETNPEEGEPFGVVVDTGTGADNDEATLTVRSLNPRVPNGAIEIAGSQSMTKDTVAGKAEFTVTLYEEARYQLVGRDEFGNVVGRAMVVVGDGGRGTGGGGGNGGGNDNGGGAAGNNAGGSGLAGAVGGLGDTGASSLTTALGLGGGALLLAGGGVLLARRRRTESVA